MARKISSRLEDLDLSQDELTRLGEALKKEEFRELLVQYAREINDPENKKRYEEEITQLENERGVDIKFVHPEPQYVLKTCFNPGGEKVFVNICSNSLVGKPSMKPSHDSIGASGISWSIPLIQAPPREDFDKSGILCTVYDVLFNPETHALASKDKRFRTFVEDTSLNAVEETFSVKLDRSSVKKPRMKFKGVPRPTVIRTRLPKSNAVKEEDEHLITQFPYPYSMPPKETPCVYELKHNNSERTSIDTSLKESYITPKYILKQSSDIDMSNYEQNHLSHHDVAIPQRLVLVVDLPYVKSSSELELDVEEKKMSLVSTGKRQYKLELKLPYPVQETKGNAKFDQEAEKLIVTLMVNREKAVIKKCQFPEGDSGIESDMCCGRVSSGDEEEAKFVMDGTTLVSPFKGLKDESASTKSLTDKIESGIKLHEECELSGHLNNSDVTENDLSMKLEENKILKESEVLSEALKEEMPPNTTNVPELFKNIPAAVVKENDPPSAENHMKCSKITQGLLLPEVQYTLPSFFCSCLQEPDSIAIIFVLQTKNVDPSSVKRKVINVSGNSINVNKQNSAEYDLHDGISLAPENVSVCNDYRTVGKSGSPLPGPLMTSASDSRDVGFGVISANLNHHANTDDASSPVCFKEASLVPTSEASDKGSLKCDISQFEGCVSEEKMKVDGAKISMLTEIVEIALSDKLRDSMLIKEGAVAKKLQADCDPSKCDKEITCFHVTFSSIGAGFFPQNFAFCVGLPSSIRPYTDSKSLEEIPVNVDVWDNNVEIQWNKSCSKGNAVEEIECFVGKDPNTLLRYSLPPFEEKSTESESFSEPDFSSLTSVSEDLRDEGTKDESDSSGIGKEIHRCSNETELSASGKRKLFKERTLSESSVESINATKQATKGILKRHGRAYLGRSLSESSGGEEYSWIGSAQHLSLSSSVPLSPSLSEINRIPLGESLKEEAEEYDGEEEDDDEDGEKVKKIVRFSDVISKKTYRSNASILGQRKKNQRKLKNKKRAAERRASESENSIDEVESTSEKLNIDHESDSSPPQNNEIPLPNNLSTMFKATDTQPVKGKPKGSVNKKSNGSKGKGKKVIEPPKSDDSSGNSTSPQYEFKSDLIFQLEL